MTETDVAIQTLSVTDIDAAFALSAAEGWNQTPADWRRLVELEPDGCFAIRDEGKLVGTVTTTTYADTLAWIGMMIVRNDRRRQGIGVTLMRQALDYLRRRGISTVKLDATPAGQPLYESLGFVAEVEVERWQGIAPPTASPNATTSLGASRQQLIELDADAYGVDRSRLIASLADDCAIVPTTVGDKNANAAGFVLARRGRAATYVGPIVASSSHDAEQLLEAALNQLAETEVCLDLHRGGHLTSTLLEARGLSRRRALVRMRYGTPNAAATDASICASAGPEYG